MQPWTREARAHVTKRDCNTRCLPKGGYLFAGALSSSPFQELPLETWLHAVPFFKSFKCNPGWSACSSGFSNYFRTADTFPVRRVFPHDLLSCLQGSTSLTPPTCAHVTHAPHQTHRHTPEPHTCSAAQCLPPSQSAGQVTVESPLGSVGRTSSCFPV